MFSSPCCNNNENSELMNLKIEKAIRDEMKNNPEAFKGDKGDKGQDFTIKKTFPSVEAMNADTSLNEGDFVLIASNENDEDNAKMYVKTKDGYQFLTDLSGAKGIKGEKGDPGQDGANGRDGVDGRSITQTGSSQDTDGNTVVSLSDGSSFKVNKGDKGDKGEDGRNGVDGRDATPLTVVSSSTNNDGNTITTLSDGSQIITQKGADGQNGRDLIVTRTETDADGNTILTLPDGSTAKIQKGDKGADGRDGVDGHDKVQISATEPTDPNISIWVKPDGENCCAVSCADLDTRLEDYYMKHAVDSKIDENNKKVFKHHKVFADIIGVTGKTGGRNFTTVKFNKIATNFGGFVLEDGIVTIPENGIYLVNASIRLKDHSDANELGMGVDTQNADGFWFHWQGMYDTIRKQYKYTRVTYFNKGDKIRLYVYDMNGEHEYYYNEDFPPGFDSFSWGNNMQIALLYPESEVQ